MATMYEMIMDLPLFKGVSKNQVSSFLEKTNVGFCNYQSGDVVIGEGDEVAMVKFVISGSVKIIHKLESLPIVIEETCDVGTVLGAERLFGISTGYAYEVVASGKLSIMQFSKEQYLNLLHSDRIYMLNFFNYLSLRAQRPVDALSQYSRGDLRSRISVLISVMTHHHSRDITLTMTAETLAKFGDMSEEAVMEWKDAAKRMELIRCKGDKIKIVSRRGFLG